MYLDVIDRLQLAHDSLCDWLQPFVLPDGTNLSKAVGPYASPPVVPYKPQCFPVGRGYKILSHFMFDPKVFSGPDAIDALSALIKTSCPGATFVKQNTQQDLIDRIVHRFRCSHYKINHRLEHTTFVPGKCTRPGVVPAREKKYQPKSQHSYSKMGTAGLKETARSRKRKQQHMTCHSEDAKPSPQHRRTDTKMADAADHRCPVCIVIFMCKSTGRWYLCPTSFLMHAFHASEASSSLLSEDDLLDNQKKFLNYLLEHGVSPTITSKIMTQVVNDSGRTGEFTPNVIQNISEKTRKLMDNLHGIDADWSVAQKMLGSLERCVNCLFISTLVLFPSRPLTAFCTVCCLIFLAVHLPSL